jgi:hypothetical protein
MERCAALIEKLQQDLVNKATPEQLIATVHILQKELSNKITPSLYKKSSKVAVLMPNSFQPNIFEPNFTPDAIFIHKKMDEPNSAEFEEKVIVPEEIISSKEILTLTEEEQVFNELPIVAQQNNVINEINNSVKDTSKDINENFANNKTELSDVLLDTPLKDLKKGIGLNDKFLFVDELFRGDEVMYERSIKTINGFNIFPEAQYWMERELKIKLGWDNKNETVEHFYNLVKRRFSEM